MWLGLLSVLWQFIAVASIQPRRSTTLEHNSSHLACEAPGIVQACDYDAPAPLEEDAEATCGSRINALVTDTKRPLQRRDAEQSLCRADVSCQGCCKAQATYTDVSFIKRGTRDLKLDIYLPVCSGYGSSQPMFPAMLYAHPGGWSYEDKSLNHPEALRLLSKGIALVSFDYRLIPEADLYGKKVATTWPAQGEDLADAIRWLKTEGAHYGIDTKQIGCWGESAGGQMCAWLAASGSQSEDTRISVAVDMFGPTCFLCRNFTTELLGNAPADWLFGFDDGRLLELYNSGAADLNDKSISRDLSLVRSAEPLEMISNNTAPMLLGHGIDDETVPFVKTQWLAERLENANVDYEILSAPGGKHMYRDWEDLDTILDQAIDFVLKYIKLPGKL